MPPQRLDAHVNPSDETIHLGPLAVRFLMRERMRVAASPSSSSRSRPRSDWRRQRTVMITTKRPSTASRGR
jgi:hypothetical protein